MRVQTSSLIVIRSGSVKLCEGVSDGGAKRSQPNEACL